MKTLHRYLLRQVIASLLMTVLVFTLVLLIGNALRDVLPLLINQRAGFGLMAQAIGLLIPFVSAFALPIGMLTATLLVFGRFSADQELTAARASGLSLMSLIFPILVFSLFLCGVSAAVNLYVAPSCRVAYKGVLFKFKTLLLSEIQIPEGRPITTFTNYIVYVEKNRNRQLENVLICQLRNGTNLESTIRAPTGEIEVDDAKHQLRVQLHNATYVNVVHGLPLTTDMTVPLPLPDTSMRSTGKPKISEMTFPQLEQELADVRERTLLPKHETNSAAAGVREIERQRRNLAEPILVQIHQQVAFSFACFSFTLIGIPLAIRVQRRETNIGIAMALLLMAVYYALIILASSQSHHAGLFPHLWMWAPNLLFQSVGAVLLWRANRGGI